MPSGGTVGRKIGDVRIYPFSIEQKQALRIAIGTMAVEGVLVRLRTEDGVTGWGEASPFAPITGDTQATAVAMGKSLAGIVRGCDPFDVPRIAVEMEALSAGEPSIKAAFEMALWDICGKIAGQPICRLFGRYRDSFETDRTVYLDTPQTMAERAQGIVDDGFKTVKVKVGEVPDTDIERLRAVRAAVGPAVRLRIDANQGWTAAEAVRALRGIEQFDIEFCEQPVIYSDWDGLKYVRNHSGIPIMADESVHSPGDAIEAVRRDAVEMINIKLMKAGGILSSMRIAEIAGAAGMKCMIGAMSEMRIALTAAAHVAMSQESILYADLDTFTEHTLDPVAGGMQVKDGIVTVPDAPGLGLDVDPAFLKTLESALSC